MLFERWISTSFVAHGQLPLAGEVILLRYPVGLIDFPHGPCASLVAQSADASHAFSGFATTATGNPKCVKTILHYVLIFSVVHDKANRKVNLVFLPILSYSSPPRGFPSSAWSPVQWMTNEASEANRLHHLAVPALGWIPPPQVTPLAPELSFGAWINTRPAWMALTMVPYSFPEVHNWFRHPSGPVLLDCNLSEISNFILSVIPTKLSELKAAANRTATTSLTAVNMTVLPNYYNFWADFYQYDSFGGAFDIPVFEALVAAHEEISNSELDRAVAGDDGCDPISFWAIPGAPPAMVEEARRAERGILERRIQEWDDHGVLEEDELQDSGNMQGYEGVVLDMARLSVDDGVHYGNAGGLGQDLTEISVGEEARALH